MSKPPKEIDGANVLYWAWSDSEPFGYISDIAIYGLAICQYKNSEDFYRFSCNELWGTEQDEVYNSVNEAVENLPEQYKNLSADWVKFE